MGKITVKILKDEHYSEDEDIKNLIMYISGKGSNKGKEHAYVDANGLRCDAEMAAMQIIGMQELLGKVSKRRAYHMIVSFTKGVKLNSVISASKHIGEMLFREKGFQCYYGVHTSTDFLHIHYCINAISYMNGKKWHTNRKEFWEFNEEVRWLANKCI